MATLDIPPPKPESIKTVGFVQESKNSMERLPTSKGAAHLRRLTELSNACNSFSLGSRSIALLKKRENLGKSFGSSG